MSGANMEPSPAWEEAFLAAWNAKFGDHAPEWVFTSQDVDREISIRKARIETLRQELNQELFLLEWLQRRASTENGFDSTSQADNTEPVVGRQPCAEAVNNINTALVKTRERISSPTPGSTDTELARKYSPVDLLGCTQPPVPLSPDSHVSSDYYSAQLHLSQGTSRSTSDSPLELEEEGTPARGRFIHRVSSTDERVAKEVHKRLLEQGQQCHQSCVDLNKKIGQSSPPLPPRRSLSDPALRHHRVQHTTAVPTLEQPREGFVCDLLSDNRAGIPSLIPASKEESRERELDPDKERREEKQSEPREETREFEPEVEKEEKSELQTEESELIAEEIQEKRKADLPEETRESGPEPEEEEKLEQREEERELTVEEEEEETKPELKSEVREEEIKSEPREGVLIAEEAAGKSEPRVETKLELREEEREPESEEVAREGEKFEERRRSNTLTLDNANDSKAAVSQEIVESTKFVDESRTMSISESNRWSKHSSDGEEGGSLGNSTFKGYSILSEEREEENDPLVSGLVVSQLHNGGLYGLSELDRDDVELLVNGEVDESCRHPNVKQDGETLTPTDVAAPEAGRAGQVESSNLDVQAQADVQKRSENSPKVRGNMKNLDPPIKRSSAYLEDEDECQTPKYEEEIMPLTLENVDKLLKESQQAKQMDSQDATVESSLDMQDIQRTLSTITSAPNMSVRTLLNVHEEEMNKRPLGTSSSEPNLLELELTESMEIDEATISAITLGNDMFGSRSNSVTSLPGLIASGDESPTLDLASPTCEGVSLRRASNSRKSANRKRMGNAELDPDWEEMVMGNDFSPTSTLSSLSSPSITSVEACNLPTSPLHHHQESSPPSPPAVSNTTTASPVSHHKVCLPCIHAVNDGACVAGRYTCFTVHG